MKRLTWLIVFCLTITTAAGIGSTRSFNAPPNSASYTVTGYNTTYTSGSHTSFVYSYDGRMWTQNTSPGSTVTLDLSTTQGYSINFVNAQGQVILSSGKLLGDIGPSDPETACGPGTNKTCPNVLIRKH